MWIFLFAVLAIFCVAALFYLYTRLMKYEYIKKLGIVGKIIGWVAPLGVVWLTVLLLGAGFFNVIIILLHLMAFWALFDLSRFIAEKIRKKKIKFYYSGYAAVALTVIVFVVGWFLAHHVYETSYTFVTDKNTGGDLRVVQISDLHLGTTLNGEEFAAELEEIQKTNPDVLVITGDFVDDDSEKADMLIACEALGNFKTKYGIFFVYGNHDKGYFQGMDFTAAELEKSLSDNNVTVLKDESVLVDDRFYIIGRKDRSDREREDINSLVSELDPSKYMIVLDHQPNDYEAEAKANVDLVLSGHTHGGHIFPAGPIGVLMGSNDSYYGTETRNTTNFVVSSGISGWGIPFKTGTISEYVVIDIKS